MTAGATAAARETPPLADAVGSTASEGDGEGCSGSGSATTGAIAGNSEAGPDPPAAGPSELRRAAPSRWLAERRPEVPGPAAVPLGSVAESSAGTAESFERGLGDALRLAPRLLPLATPESADAVASADPPAFEPIGSAAATDGRPMIAPPTPSAIASAPTRPTEFVERVKGANNH